MWLWTETRDHLTLSDALVSSPTSCVIRWWPMVDSVLSILHSHFLVLWTFRVFSWMFLSVKWVWLCTFFLGVLRAFSVIIHTKPRMLQARLEMETLLRWEVLVPVQLTPEKSSLFPIASWVSINASADYLGDSMSSGKESARKKLRKPEIKNNTRLIKRWWSFCAMMRVGIIQNLQRFQCISNTGCQPGALLVEGHS